ncbi:histone deacetylase family protein [Hymenobacter chitinivorans]|uniref:Acetoin utilization deacetylase AcuC-like enzyme n=1 Tax=Hymenobacter chitinivorans DSM 11115 TaxID=1121954 RepID=A0A2M9BST8_9BACT|nr:histone deacetylase [Hymenobacter chitinivorans]PJJ60991.1 acetoin utilization deacetylase AcuC-like enzyme [Hymenobacter chitinivorans DSM 11115]
MPCLATSERYTLDLPVGHRFPIAKYELIREQLLWQGIAPPHDFYDPGLCAEEDVLRVHTMEYWHKVRDQQLSAAEVRRLGLPQSERLVLRSLSSSAGTVQSARRALRDGVALNLAGGTHHAFADRGEGFCVLNDIAIAAAHLLHHGLARQVLVVDLDVHQGDGTASIFRHEPRVFTFSMHAGANYPLRKEQSDLDVALPLGLDDAGYLRQLTGVLPSLVDSVQPDFIFFQAGVDVLATDKLGKLALTKAGCRARDEFVLGLCRQRGLPVAVSMGGGYSERIGDIVDAHCNTFRVAYELYGE